MLNYQSRLKPIKLGETTEQSRAVYCVLCTVSTLEDILRYYVIKMIPLYHKGVIKI